MDNNKNNESMGKFYDNLGFSVQLSNLPTGLLAL